MSVKKVLLATVVCVATCWTRDAMLVGKDLIKLRGYVTAVPNTSTLQILDDVVHVRSRTSLEIKDAPAGQKVEFENIPVGVLVDVEGSWRGRHQFDAEKVICHWGELEREIHRSAYVEVEPLGSQDALVRLKVDGELVVLDDNLWHALKQDSQSTAGEDSKGTVAGRLVRYTGVRQANGSITASQIEVGPAAPREAFEIPGGVGIARSTDSGTDVASLEFRHKDSVLGRKKLFDVQAVQDYVSELGNKLVPSNEPGTPRPGVEFRFFVIEDSEINAAAFPDGTVLVNSGLLGAVENESQLAFVLSHELAHTLQAHNWRETRDTRNKRAAVTAAMIAAAAAGAVTHNYQIGNISSFLGNIGLTAIWNGYSRSIENQADRLGLENAIDHGYDPRQAVRFFQIVIERYGDRSTSALWSNHDSSVMRGSFIAVQLQRRYPAGQFDQATVSTPAFDSMKEALGPVKIM